MLALRSAIAEISSSSASVAPEVTTTFFPAPDSSDLVSTSAQDAVTARQARHQYVDDVASSPRPPTSTSSSSSLWALAKDTTVDNTTITSTDSDAASCCPGEHVQYLRIEVLHSSNLPRGVRLLDLTLHTVCVRLALKNDWRERVCVLPIGDLPSDGQALTLKCQLLTLENDCALLVREGSVELAAVFCFVRTSKMVQLPFSMVHTIAFHEPESSHLLHGEAQIKLTFTNQVPEDDVLAEEVPVGTIPAVLEDVSHSEVTNWDDIVRTLPQPILVESASTIPQQPEPRYLNTTKNTSVQETIDFTLSLTKLVVENSWLNPPKIASVQVTIGDLTGESRMAQLEFDRGEYDLLTDFNFPLIVERLGRIRKPFAPQTVMQFIVRNPEHASSGKSSGSFSTAMRGRAKFRETLERFLRLDFVNKAIAFEIPVIDGHNILCRLLCTLRVAASSGETSSYTSYGWEAPPYCLQHQPEALYHLHGAVSCFQPTMYCEASIAPYVIVCADGLDPLVSPVVVAPISRPPGDIVEYQFPGTFEFDFETTRSQEIRFEVWSHGGHYVNSRLGEGRCIAPINDYTYHSVQIRNPMDTTVGYLSVSLNCQKF